MKNLPKCLLFLIHPFFYPYYLLSIHVHLTFWLTFLQQGARPSEAEFNFGGYSMDNIPEERLPNSFQ